MGATNAVVGTKSKKPGKKGGEKPPEVVAGVKLSRVDKDRLASVATQMGIVPSGLLPTLEAVAKKVADMPGDEVVSCEGCGGEYPPAPGGFDACPYCGLTEDEAAQSEAVSSSAPESSEASSVAMFPSGPPGRGSLLTGGKVVEGHIVSAGEAQLDDAVSHINTAKRDTAAAYYALGHSILAVFKNRLWQQRQRNGKPAYKSFEDFRRVELMLPKSSVYGMMKLVEKFTVGQIEEYGTTRLNLILMAPEKKQDEFAAFVKSGGKAGSPMSTKKAKAKLRELNADRDKGKGTKGGRPQAAPRPGELTLATVFGKKHTIPLWTPGKDKQGNPVAAKKLDDQPWGYIDLKNGARIVLKVAHFPSGQLKILAEFRHEDA